MIRFAIIGTSKITETFLKGAFLNKDFCLNAVYSRNESTAKEFAKKYNAKHTFTDLNKMAQSDLVDAVYIASPNSFHASQSILFLKNKKHVLCEKPFASNSIEVSEMIKTAKENNVLLMEAMKTTILPNFQIIKENLHKIGQIRKYVGNFCRYSSRYDEYKQGRVLNTFNPVFSNGSLMDIGVYCIAPMVNLFGKPKEIKASGLLLESGVDGEGIVSLKYDNMEALINHSKICNSYLPSEIQGEEGSIIIEQINSFEKVKIIYRNGNTEELSTSHVSENMYYEVTEFIDLIKNNKFESKINTFENSKIVMEIMDEARRQIGLSYPADII